MTDTWHTELERDGDRWSFTLTQNGIVHTAMRNYRSRAAALKAADWHRSWPVLPSIAEELERIGL